MVQKSKSIYIVIAAWNEEKSILNVIKDLRDNGYNNIIIVDDGSKDNTYETAHKSGVFALRHSVNRGQGAALKTGIDFAVKLGADVIVTFDADGQHLASDIPAITSPVVNDGYDIALGSRFLRPRSNIPVFKKIMLKGAVFLMYIFYGAKLSDAHNGFRAISPYAATKMNLTSDRYEHASEIISEVMSKKLRYIEVPVTIIYNSYSMQKGGDASKHGQSMFNSFKILGRMILKKLLEL